MLGLLRRLFGRTTPVRNVPVSTGLSISYGPRRDGRPDPGEVVWAWVPYEDDPKQGKDRPVLVIGRIGRGGRALAALPLTSQDRSRDRHYVPVGPGGWDRQRRASYAAIDRLLQIDPTAVRREGAALDRARFDAVVAAYRARVR